MADILKWPWEPYRPSNGTEGEIFMEGFCYRCTKEPDCEILSNTLALDIDDRDYPKEWRRRTDSNGWPGTAECTAFEKEGK